MAQEWEAGWGPHVQIVTSQCCPNPSDRQGPGGPDNRNYRWATSVELGGDEPRTVSQNAIVQKSRDEMNGPSQIRVSAQSRQSGKPFPRILQRLFHVARSRASGDVMQRQHFT
jgi:hypothetical protein